MKGLATAIACAVVPALTVLCGVMLLMIHLMEKISMTGAPPPLLRWGPDAIIGALFGAGFYTTAGYLIAWLAHCIRKHFKVGCCLPSCKDSVLKDVILLGVVFYTTVGHLIPGWSGALYQETL